LRGDAAIQLLSERSRHGQAFAESVYEFTALISPTFVNPDARLRIVGASRSNR
jgi:hypothetical protein